jgi:predicted transcriptional regulator YdeE
MDAKIITANEWLVVGMSFYGDPFSNAAGWSEDNEIGRLWQRFMSFVSQRHEAVQHWVNPGAMLEIHVYNTETMEKGFFEVFVGVQVAQLADVPLDCTVKVLPPATYAVFTLSGQQITSDWSKALSDWLAASAYERSYPYIIQWYDDRFKGMDNIAESVLEAYIPVKPKDPKVMSRENF